MKKIIFLLAFLFVFTIIAQDALAIPAFARKYRLSCQTCHNPFPKLKPYGEEFAANGFKLADKEAPRYYEDTGDPLLKLIRDFPIAARLEAYVTANFEDNRKIDFGTPYLMKFLSGGELYNNISYYFYFYFDERGEVAGVEDAFLMFNNLFGSGLDVTVGQFQVSDPLFKRELRLPLEDYKLYTMKPHFSDIDLAYDRGIMLTYGLPWGTDLAFQVLNGNGLSAANLRIFDKDKYKSFTGRISQDIAGIARVGGYAYWGKETSINNILLGSNEAFIWGPDITIDVSEYAQLNMQYLRRTDKFDHTLSYENVNADGAMAELLIFPQGDESRLYFAALGNYIYTKGDNPNGFYIDKYLSITGHAGYLLSRNLRLIAESSYIIDEHKSEFVVLKKDYPIFSLGFVTAF